MGCGIFPDQGSNHISYIVRWIFFFFLTTGSSERPILFSFACGYTVFSGPFVEKTLLSHKIDLASLLKII